MLKNQRRQQKKQGISGGRAIPYRFSCGSCIRAEKTAEEYGRNVRKCRECRECSACISGADFDILSFFLLSGCGRRREKRIMGEEREKDGRMPGERENCGGSAGRTAAEGLLPRANRNYKDTVFRMLFKEKENLLSLYNAVAGTAYTDASELEVVTLENAVYMGMANDIAFLIGTGLYLYEHQSTVNPNMPLRDLLYISSEYQVLLKDKTLYSSALLRIPAPKFFVFYNGKEDIGERTELKLSDSYITPQEDPDLELKVTVLNINAGHNKELMENCQMLDEYSLYVARVRKHAAEMKPDEAVERAVTECIREGILADFLRRNRAEVVKVSIFEYDREEEEKKIRKAEYEYGLERGLERGRTEGLEQGMERMRAMMIRNLSRMKIPMEQIVQASGMGEAEVRKCLSEG